MRVTQTMNNISILDNLIIIGGLGCSFHVRPLMVSAHPQKPNQIALGLNIGRVIVLEPAQPEGNWAEQPPAPHNGTSSAVRPVIIP